jgi:hypothetical protein
MSEFNFKVETKQAGQKRKYGDSFYHYEVISIHPEHQVNEFCTNVLMKSYKKKDMPNPFAGELLEFKKITDNNKDKGFFDDRKEETYSYKVRCEYTG